MASPVIKATYSLDVETANMLEKVAKQLGESKSGIVKKAIRAFVDAQVKPAKTSTEALDRLQQSLQLSRGQATRWTKRVSDERRQANRADIAKA